MRFRVVAGVECGTKYPQRTQKPLFIAVKTINCERFKIFLKLGTGSKMLFYVEAKLFR
jgi:hypothetical protein